MHQSDRNTTDPFETLGLPQTATQEEVRERYLELVKENPPEKNPEEFGRINEAYKLAKNPLLIAENLLSEQSLSTYDSWDDIIETHKNKPPSMSPRLILALGNRDAARDKSANTANLNPAETLSNDE